MSKRMVDSRVDAVVMVARHGTRGAYGLRRANPSNDELAHVAPTVHVMPAALPSAVRELARVLESRTQSYNVQACSRQLLCW